jgi:hypothetical protein
MNEQMTIEFNTMVFGLGKEQRSPSVYIALPERVLSVRALVEQHVRAEVQRAQEQRSNSLALHYILSNTPHTPPESYSQPLDVDHEIERACTALHEGRYLLLVDGLSFRKLDEQVSLTERSVVAFVRLVPLVGG